MEKPAAIWLVLLTLLLTACSNHAIADHSASPIYPTAAAETRTAGRVNTALPESTTMPILNPAITPTTAAPSAGCGSLEVVQRIKDFVDAFNLGDQQQLATFFGAHIEAFSVSDRLPGQATARVFNADHADAILAYLADRHRHDEHWELIDARSPYYEATRNLADYGFDLRRSADDLRLEQPGNLTGNTQGKGAMHCEDRTLSIWAMNTA